MSPAEILRGIGKLRVLVAGDVCLDRWCWYDPALAEASRETGIPRIAVVRTEVTPGAAGTVANNLAALGAERVDVLGLIGGDGFGFELEQALAARRIGTRMLLRVPGAATFTYTKLLNSRTGEEDLPRVDFLYTELPAGCAAGYDVIIVSDQAETDAGGAITPAMRAALARIAETHPEALIWVDSRTRAEHFRRVIVKPNLHEAEAASCRALGRVDFPALRRLLEAPLLVVTHGGDGAEVIDAEATRFAPGKRIANPVDICGAGDSFSAGAALALKVTGDPMAAAVFGNLVASITIMKKGTGTASPEEILGK
jgi:bifunctional ADP-heptose synthase (sugar kinase/adenylyltransferase)